MSENLDVSNSYGVICPKCHRGDGLFVSVFRTFLLGPSGSTEYVERSNDLDDISNEVLCEACEWEGTFDDLEKRVD